MDFFLIRNSFPNKDLCALFISFKYLNKISVKWNLASHKNISTKQIQLYFRDISTSLNNLLVPQYYSIYFQNNFISISHIMLPIK